ncbi:MAG TPA: DUF799 family lipoprotein [Smithellaceae bacterium]|nr:DUF799 family lipoprotein [Smithellaceae bacterium]
MIASGRMILVIGLFFLLAGCGSKVGALGVKQEQPAPRQPLVIAVLPVANQTTDEVAPQILRERLLDELYFRGYKKLAPETVDRTLGQAPDKTLNDAFNAGRIRSALGADSAMRCELTESSVSVRLFYAPVHIAVRCELWDMVSGEVLWSKSCRATHRSFDITPARVKMKSYGGFEAAIDELVADVLETLPYGPELKG